MSCCADPSVHAPHGSCDGNQSWRNPATRPSRRTGMQIAHSAQIEIKHDTTFGQILRSVNEAEIPDEARVTVDKYVGDQRDPGYCHIKFAWTTGGTS